MKYNFYKPTILAALSIVSLLTSCKKENNDSSLGNSSLNAKSPNINSVTRGAPLYIMWGNHIREISVGGYYTYSGQDGNVKWDCSTLATICHIRSLKEGSSGNGGWYDDGQVTALHLFKNNETMELYNHTIQNGVYTATSTYKIALFNDGDQLPNTFYEVTAGSYPVKEDNTSFTIVFKDNR